MARTELSSPIQALREQRSLPRVHALNKTLNQIRLAQIVRENHINKRVFTQASQNRALRRLSQAKRLGAGMYSHLESSTTC